MKARTYSPNGRGHLSLARLAAGPAPFADLVEAAGVSRQRDRTKLFLTIQALREDDYVRRAGPELYAITERGAELLERLRVGESVRIEVAVPNVRVFAREAA